MNTIFVSFDENIFPCPDFLLIKMSVAAKEKSYQKISDTTYFNKNFRKFSYCFELLGYYLLLRWKDFFTVMLE